MAIEIIPRSISTKVWDWGDELVTPGSAVRHISAVRHVTDCATGQVGIYLNIQKMGFLSSNTEWHTQMLHENEIISYLCTYQFILDWLF